MRRHGVSPEKHLAITTIVHKTGRLHVRFAAFPIIQSKFPITPNTPNIRSYIARCAVVLSARVVQERLHFTAVIVPG